VIVDTAAPGTKPSASERLVARAEELQREVNGGFVERAAVTSARALRWSASSVVAHAARAAVLASVGVIPRRNLDQYHLFYRLASKQRRRYRPKRTFGGTTLLVRADDTEDDRALGEDLGWSPYLRGAFEVSHFAGDHATIIKRPHVSALAEELQRAFNANA
jgi:thioesterase domain-containing protein